MTGNEATPSATTDGPAANPEDAPCPDHPPTPPEHSPLPNPNTLGELSPAALAATLRPLFEDAGPLVARLQGRSWPTWSALIDAAAEEVATMDDDERAILLTAHPRIGESPSALAARSPESFREQGAGDGDGDGDGDEGPATEERLEHLNRAYEKKFGFPFVEWVAGRPRAAIIPVIEWRLGRQRGVELAAGTRALLSIARDRLDHRSS